MLHVLFGVWLYMIMKHDHQHKQERHLDSCDLWLWRRMIKMKWSDRMKNDEALTKKPADSNKKEKHLGWAIYCAETVCS